MRSYLKAHLNPPAAFAAHPPPDRMPLEWKDTADAVGGAGQRERRMGHLFAFVGE